MNSPKPSGASIDTAKLVRRATFFVCLIGLATISIFFTFQGLSSPRAMEQAQLGREIARGNGFTTKVIRPLAIWQIEEEQEKVPSLQKLPATYHAPLNPLIYAGVLKIADGGNSEAWKMPPRTNIYQLDRLIAVTCVIFFLISIGVNFLLLHRVFDATIAATVALLMLFCELMWSLSQSGMPQMLMLMLFSCGMFFAWRAVEKSQENRSVLIPIFISGVFMSLLVLTHWITLWIYIGFVIFAAFYFKPRGIVAILLASTLAIFVTPVIYFLYIGPTGSPLGTAFYAIHDGLGLSQDSIMRSLSPDGEKLDLQGLLLNIIATSLRQITDLHQNMGAIIVAPLFFIALLHPFKRATLASFRWLILLMWAFAGLGMSVFGIRAGAMDPNQIHILFAPVMAGYGLALISIMWNRLNLGQSVHAARHAHLIVIVAISAGPMLLSMPQDIRMGIRASEFGGAPHWPPYLPYVYNQELAENTKATDIVISDAPWAVAWYADRMSLWLPQDLEQIQTLEEIASSQDTPVSSILITPYSYASDNILVTVANKNSPYGKLYPLVMGAWGYKANTTNFIDSHPDFRSLSQRYPHKKPLQTNGQIILYSARPTLRSSD